MTRIPDLDHVDVTVPHLAGSASPLRVALRAAIATLLCTLLTVACHAPQPSQVAVAENLAKTPTPDTTPVTSAQPTSPFALSPAAAAHQAAGAPDYQTLLGRYTPTQQAQINDWYAKHAASPPRFVSNAQWQWMQQHDYPTPDDILRATHMSDEQLRKLAQRGDTKANFFYLARLLDEHARAGADTAAGNHNNKKLQTGITASMDRALASGSAFAGYMYGDYYAALHGEGSAGAGDAAGVMWADARGDSNAMYHSHQMSMGFPGVSGVQAAEAYFDMFAAAARINPYFRNAYRGLGGPSMPLQ